eukprot:277452-Amphidinium_carterae.1
MAHTSIELVPRVIFSRPSPSKVAFASQEHLAQLHGKKVSLAFGVCEVAKLPAGTERGEHVIELKDMRITSDTMTSEGQALAQIQAPELAAIQVWLWSDMHATVSPSTAQTRGSTVPAGATSTSNPTQAGGATASPVYKPLESGHWRLDAVYSAGIPTEAAMKAVPAAS